MERITLFAIVAGLLMVVSGAGAYRVSESGTPASSAPFASPIDHVVIIMMENHAYDSYFETYCLQLSPECNQTANGIAPGTCEPMKNMPGGCVVPYNFTDENLSPPDMLHTYNSTVMAINNGNMNGFYKAEGHRMEPFGHYNGSTVPVYWDMAQEFGLGDDFFSAALSYSLPNHWYLLAGQAPPQSIEQNMNTASVAERHTYLNQSNSTESVQDLLLRNNVSFRYYDWPLTTYQKAIQPVNPTSANVPGKGSAYAFWNPLASKAESYTSAYDSAFVARDQIFSDLKDGSLPNVSYVIPMGPYSDHPPANITLGEAFVANVVDAVEYSPYWNHTAIFLTWDEYGGFYDNVAPPSIDPLGLSIRVPFLVMSPYTPAGTLVNTLGYFESTLAFIEDRWGLQSQCMTARDCDAPNLANYFDFSMTPRAPVFFDPNWENDTYPYQHESYAADKLDTTSWVGQDNPAIDEDTD
jgi:phospholipase C